MNDYDGEMFHHHEGCMLDDGTQVEDLPAAKKPGVSAAGGAGAVREKQVQQYSLKRRAAARNSRRTHTSH